MDHNRSDLVNNKTTIPGCRILNSMQTKQQQPQREDQGFQPDQKELKH